MMSNLRITLRNWQKSTEETRRLTDNRMFKSQVFTLLVFMALICQRFLSMMIIANSAKSPWKYQSKALKMRAASNWILFRRVLMTQRTSTNLPSKLQPWCATTKRSSSKKIIWEIFTERARWPNMRRRILRLKSWRQFSRLTHCKVFLFMATINAMCRKSTNV